MNLLNRPGSIQSSKASKAVELRAVDRLSGSTALSMSERPQLVGSIAQAVRELARESSWDKNIWSPRPPREVRSDKR
jgi:hypothetical protein